MKTKKTAKKLVGCRLDQKDYEQFKVKASKNGRTVAGEVRYRILWDLWLKGAEK